jgi:peptide-methionine (S)-S-oxide reductase
MNRWLWLVLSFLAAFALLNLWSRAPIPTQSKETRKVVPSKEGLEVATIGGGCFWCLEAVFLELEGVEQVVCGYSGGKVDNPTYKQVCNGDTGHAEVVQIYYDPSKFSFDDLMDVFFHLHDPTTLNRQGDDVGTQYRSVVYYHDEDQKKRAEAAKAKAQANYNDPIVTEITALSKFYQAEDYHQNYYANNTAQPYCSFVVGPKVAKVRSQYKDRLKKAER